MLADDEKQAIASALRTLIAGSCEDILDWVSFAEHPTSALRLKALREMAASAATIVQAFGLLENMFKSSGNIAQEALD